MEAALAALGGVRHERKSPAVVFHCLRADPAGRLANRHAVREGDLAVNVGVGRPDRRGAAPPALRVLRIWRKDSCSPVAAPTPEEKANRDQNLTVYSFNILLRGRRMDRCCVECKCRLNVCVANVLSRADAVPGSSGAALASHGKRVSCVDAAERSFGDAEWVDAALTRVDDLELVRSIAEAVRARGVEFVLVILPSQSADRRFEERLIQELGSPVLRYNQPERYPQLYDPELRYDSGHLSAEGAVWFSQVLARDYWSVAGARGARDGNDDERPEYPQ